MCFSILFELPSPSHMSLAAFFLFVDRVIQLVFLDAFLPLFRLFLFLSCLIPAQSMRLFIQFSAHPHTCTHNSAFRTFSKRSVVIQQIPPTSRTLHARYLKSRNSPPVLSVMPTAAYISDLQGGISSQTLLKSPTRASKSSSDRST
ncbi:hypothetical protein DE146DRAFT_392075 [Phaeosphaeria sp. MPI-PUGE-AT-0046c]|nr:hypothetical protein DE146DRAFT_392075 [Phaeosphaeria sp. MPI-PUGE-AT-0046c]